MNKHNIVTLIGTCAFLLVTVVYAAYAAISPTISVNNLNINTDITGGPIAFVASGANTLNIEVDFESMAQDYTNNIVASASDDVVISLDTDGSEAICCTYDIVWQWEQTSNTKNQYKLSSGGSNEYVLDGRLTEKYLAADGTTKTGTNNIEKFKKQIPDYNASSLSNVMYSSQICNHTNALSAHVTQTYKVTSNFYNLDVVQDHLKGAQFNGSLKLNNVSCSKINLATHVIAQATGSDFTSSQDSSVYRVIDENGYRYEGKNPDNYVTFNGEEYRIIGAFEGSTIGLSAGKYYTKIIRSAVLPALTDRSTMPNSNVVNSQLYKALNTTFYNGTNLTYSSTNFILGLTKQSRDKLVKATWYVGATDSSYQAYKVSDYYSKERGTTKGLDASVTSFTGFVGLMYPSDYGYAAYGGSCTRSARMYDYQNPDSGSCASYDWLLDSSYQYTITPSSVTGNGGKQIARINANGQVAMEQYLSDYSSRSFRPAMYLSSDVQIISGNGSKAKPFILG